MTSLRDFNIDKLKTEFQSILHLQTEVLRKKTLLTEKLAELKEVYNGLVKNNNKKIFLFCLDSFYFQYKTLMIEMENLSRYISLINNRMYGDYYKLYHIVLLQVSEAGLNIDMRHVMSEFKKYVPYKDLEPFYEYRMSDIIRLHSDILQIIHFLYNHYSKKEQNITTYTESPHAGISITSFIQTLEYENTLLREQITLYVNYIHFFHISQSRFLKKLFCKIQAFQSEIEDDIISNHPKTPDGGGGGGGDAGSTAQTLESFFILKPEEMTEIEVLLCETEKSLAKCDQIFYQLELPEIAEDMNSEFNSETQSVPDDATASMASLSPKKMPPIYRDTDKTFDMALSFSSDTADSGPAAAADGNVPNDSSIDGDGDGDGDGDDVQRIEKTDDTTPSEGGSLTKVIKRKK